LSRISLDGYPAVKKGGPLITGLATEVTMAGKRVTWGPKSGWKTALDKDGLWKLETAMYMLEVC